MAQPYPDELLRLLAAGGSSRVSVRPPHRPRQWVWDFNLLSQSTALHSHLTPGDGVTIFHHLKGIQLPDRGLARGYKLKQRNTCGERVGPEECHWLPWVDGCGLGAAGGGRGGRSSLTLPLGILDHLALPPLPFPQLHKPLSALSTTCSSHLLECPPSSSQASSWSPAEVTSSERPSLTTVAEVAPPFPLLTHFCVPTVIIVFISCPCPSPRGQLPAARALAVLVTAVSPSSRTASEPWQVPSNLVE